MRPAVVKIVIGLVAAWMCAPAPAALGQEQTGTGSGAEGRPVATIVRLGVPPLFEADGRPRSTAGRHIDELLERIRRLEGEMAEVPFALALDGVTCDELEVVGSEPARRALAALRRLSRTRTFLRTLYSGSRLDHIGRAVLASQLRSGDDAIERCLGRLPDEPFLPPDGVLGGADRIEDLASMGVGSALSAYAVPPSTQRPRILPAVMGDPGPDLAGVRPETTPVVLVLDPDEITALDGQPATGTRRVDLGEVLEADVTAGAIGPEVGEPRGLDAAVGEASQALALLRSFTLPDDEQAAALRTVLGRAMATALWWPSIGIQVARAEGVTDAVERRRRQISLSTGSVTFTSRRGVIPVTVSNDSAGPVDVLVALESPKLDFPAGRSQRVTVQPPGDTVTFEALARSSGTFPVEVSMRAAGRTEDGSGPGAVLDRSSLSVRSAASNLSAVILTAGGAAFLVVWFIRRRRDRSKAHVEVDA